MESNSVNTTTHDFPHGNEKKKPSIPLKELVMEALLSASSTGMVVSEIYEFINGRCKEYDLAENRWKINVRNMLTTSVYFHCFPRKERDGRRGRCWKFNIDAYNLHLQMKGNREQLTRTQTEDIRRNFIGSIGGILPADPASFNNFNTSIFPFNPSQTGSQQTELSRIHPTHQDNAWSSSNIIAAIPHQTVQMSSMHNQYASHPIQMQQTRYSNGTDFTNTVGLRANPVDQFLHHSVQQARFSGGDSVKTVRRNYVNRFVPYDVRDSRNYTHLANTIATPGRKQDTCSTQQHYVQHSSQSYSLASVNSASSWMVQAYPPIDSGDYYSPQNVNLETQLKSTDPYHYGVSQ